MIEENSLRNIKRSMHWLLRDSMETYRLADKGLYDEKSLNKALEYHNAALAEYCELYLKTFKGKSMADIIKIADD